MNAPRPTLPSAAEPLRAIMRSFEFGTVTATVPAPLARPRRAAGAPRRRVVLPKS